MPSQLEKINRRRTECILLCGVIPEPTGVEPLNCAASFELDFLAQERTSGLYGMGHYIAF